MAKPKATITGKLPRKAGTSKAAHAARIARFIEEYLSNGENASQAAIAVGYSAHSARRTGTRLTTDVHISAQIAARRKTVLAACELTTERTLRQIARIAFSDVRKLFNLDGTVKRPAEWDDDVAAFVSLYKDEPIKHGGKIIGRRVKVEFCDKVAALEMAIKVQKLYPGDARHTGELTPTVIIHGDKCDEHI